MLYGWLRMGGGISTSILPIRLKHNKNTTLIALSAHLRAELHGHGCRKVPTAEGPDFGVGIAKVYEVNPLECVKCGSPMKILAVITDPEEVKKIPVRGTL